METNAISDHEMSFEIKHTLSIISGSNWENLPIYPYAYKKKNECIHLILGFTKKIWILKAKKLKE